ncbi:MAG: hypothetical protein NVSMB39_7310 [Candidatus Saccharimonadales bacterium]
MSDFHAYTTPDAVYFRRTGGEKPPVKCKVLETRATWGPGDLVSIADFGSGSGNYRFNNWFADWTDEDYMHPDDLQSGRPIQIAIPVDAFEVLEAGHTLPKWDAGWYFAPTGLGQRDTPFRSPVAAVLIDGRWVEPA